MKRFLSILVLTVFIKTICFSAVALDNKAANTGGSGQTSLALNIDIANNPNRVLIVFTGAGNQTNGKISTVVGGGATWSRVGAGNGNGTYYGECWVGINPTAGAATLVTVNWAGTTDQVNALIVYSFYNADQTTGANGFQLATSGNLVVTTNSGDYAVSGQVDLNNNRGVSGCTSVTDISAFGSAGYSGASCATSGTATFTWDGFDTNSVAVGANVIAAGSGAAAVQVYQGPFFSRRKR